MRIPLLMLIAVTLSACQPSSQTSPEESAPADAPTAQTPIPIETNAAETLAALLALQPDEVKARYEYRHPQETLEFFGIEPGMVVVEGLPGRGWYTKLLLPYLGEDGCLIGANYEFEMWPLFDFATDEFVDGMRNWKEDFKSDAAEWRGENGAEVRAFEFGSMPEEYEGTADVVFFARVLHNLANFENAGKGEYLSRALADAFAVLKPGGIFAVVQHQARDEMSDEWASGTHGYLKKSFVISRAEAAGFELVAETDINQNDRDQPTSEDIVWRLPPNFFTSAEDEALKAKYMEIGESNRMTLKFRKPL